MLTDPGDIGKIQGALEKLTDATEKLCGCVLSSTVTEQDHQVIQDTIDAIGAYKQGLSLLIPPEPM